MKLAKEIQKRLGKKDYSMAKDMSLPDSTAWIRFKESKADYLTRLYRLYEISGLTASQFIELFKK